MENLTINDVQFLFKLMIDLHQQSHGFQMYGHWGISSPYRPNFEALNGMEIICNPSGHLTLSNYVQDEHGVQFDVKQEGHIHLYGPGQTWFQFGDKILTESMMELISRNQNAKCIHLNKRDIIGIIQAYKSTSYETFSYHGTTHNITIHIVNPEKELIAIHGLRTSIKSLERLLETHFIPE